MREVRSAQPEAPKEENRASFFARVATVFRYMRDRKAEPYFPGQEYTGAVRNASGVPNVSDVLSAMKPNNPDNLDNLDNPRI